MVVGDEKSWNCLGDLMGFSVTKFLYFSTPIVLHFMRFLKQIFGYTALHYTVNRLNLMFM